MKIGMAAEYAIRCVLYLSANCGRTVPRKEISKAMDIPEQFLVKIAHELSKSGILTILQGRKGGYRLSIPPEKLTILHVLEAITGEISLNPCVRQPEFCKRSSTCLLRPVWVMATEKLRGVLGEVTFSEVLGSAKGLTVGS